MDRYREEYGLDELPAPAFIVDELITDFLSARLRFDPLPVDRYAQTELVDGRLTITVNKLTADIPGVVDVEGVQNVAKFHESIHVVRDADLLRTRQQFGLNDMETAEHIVCFRQGFGRSLDREASRREFWAEEAGRAAAICHRSLSRSHAYNALMDLGASKKIRNDEAWRLLYQAAADIGVNRSALATQLEAEERISVTTKGGRQVLEVRPTIGALEIW